MPSKKRKSVLSSPFVLIGALFLVFLGVRSVALLQAQPRPQVRVYAAIPPTTMPTAKPTPASPSATPIPYVGFCLNVPVLYYHHIQPLDIARQKGQTSLTVDNSFFAQQMAYITSHGYHIIFASDLVNALATHTALPQNSMIVTIDDAYGDVYTYAFPIIKQYGIKASLFIPTGLLGVTSGTNTYFSWDQLTEMVNSGLAEADDHTWSHFAVGTGNSQKDQYEIMTAKQQLIQHFGHTPPVFAYPYGTNAMQYQVHTLLQADGFLGAFSTIAGTYQCDSFILSLHRTRIGNSNFPAFGIY